MHAKEITTTVIRLLQNKDFTAEEIGMIAPYNDQVVKIKEMREKAAGEEKGLLEQINKVQVSTIHSFQDMETPFYGLLS